MRNIIASVVIGASVALMQSTAAYSFDITGITKANTPACLSKDATFTFIRLANDPDTDAFRRFLIQQERAGNCRLIYKGTKVRIVEMAEDPTFIICAKVQNDAPCYWVLGRTLDF